jgi:hypothetical protein
VNEAQLYWDAQDPKNTGWWLRYRDDRGEEQGVAVEEAADATTSELAVAVKAAIGIDSMMTGTVKVVRGNRTGTIRIVNGEITDWRAL